jgi:hypothetical protein
MQERKTQRKVRPTHPGMILRNMLTELAEDGNDQFASLTRKELAKRLGVSPLDDRRHGDSSIASVQDNAGHLDEFTEGC